MRNPFRCDSPAEDEERDLPVEEMWDVSVPRGPGQRSAWKRARKGRGNEWKYNPQRTALPCQCALAMRSSVWSVGTKRTRQEASGLIYPGARRPWARAACAFTRRYSVSGSFGTNVVFKALPVAKALC